MLPQAEHGLTLLAGGVGLLTQGGSVADAGDARQVKLVKLAPPPACPLPQGTYFLVADFSGLLPEGSTEDDVQASREGRPCATCHALYQNVPCAPRCTKACGAAGCAARGQSASPLAASTWLLYALVPWPCFCASLQFCYRLTREAGVTLIPVSAFYADRATAPRTLVRFVFCKTDEKLQTACDKLRRYFAAQANGRQ